MTDQSAASAEARAALFEFQRYLSDQVAPLMVADEMAILLRYPAQLVIAEIQSWTSAQYRGRGASVPLSDYLYHAVKKVHQFGEFDLVSDEQLANYLRNLKTLVLGICPAEDRELLQQNLQLLGEVSTTAASQVDILHRQAGSEVRLASASPGTVGGATMSDAAVRGLQRLSTFAERLDRDPRFSGAGAGPQRFELDSEMISTAAVSSQNGADLRELLERLRAHGVDTSSDRMFKALGASLPTWAVPPSAEGAPQAVADGEGVASPLEAMHKIISMAEDPGEGARRFREMLSAAIELFNTGQLARAVTMFDLAERIIAEKRVDDSIVKSIRGSASESLDAEQLRQCVEQKEKHFLLRRLFNFFTNLTPEGILTDLEFEEKRERRRALLGFLEVHGEPARAAALERLARIPAVSDKATGFYARNLLYVLNHVPRGAGGVAEAEIDVLSGFSGLSNPPLVIREALLALGQIQHERSERVLIGRLHEIEAQAIKGGESHSVRDLRTLLDRAIAALIKLGTSHALRAVAEHGLKTQEPLGDTRARISALGAIDLSEHADALNRIVAAVRTELPVKVLGYVARKEQPQLVKLMELLAVSPAPAVRELLEDVVGKFHDRDFSETAESILAAFGAAPARPQAAAAPQSASLMGDLELFGLPNLLQSLAESHVSGALMLTDPAGRTFAAIGIESGKLARCHVGAVRGKEGIFQLFERPRPGLFAFFNGRALPGAADLPQPVEVTPLIFEAMRRHDELRRAKLLVPETMKLKVTGVKPVPLAAEDDARLVREVWIRASSGSTPGEWEEDIAADSYRVWRLLAHWVESGALEVVGA